MNSRSVRVKITISEMRAGTGPEIVVHCLGCTHSELFNVDTLPGETRLSDLEPKLVCARCGHVGADVRPYNRFSTGHRPAQEAKPWPRQGAADRD